MVWTVLKVVGVALLLFVAYVAWVLFRASGNLGETPTAHAEILTDRIRVTVSFPSADSEYQITEVLLSREIGNSLGISSPDGFSLQPYTLHDTGDPKSEDSAKWVEDANSRDIRWVGSQPLTQNANTTLDFPIENDVRREISLRFQYERRLGMGGQISFFNVSVDPAGTS